MPVEELAAITVRAVVEKSVTDPARIDDVVFAQSYASSKTPCAGRWAALQAGLPVTVRACSSTAVVAAACRP